jgi:hypothetical protein
VYRVALSVFAAAAFLPWQLWNLTTAAEIESAQTAARSQVEGLAGILKERSVGDCLFAIQYGWPQIEFYSGCEGARYIRDAVLPFGDDPESGTNFALARIPPSNLHLDERWIGQEASDPALAGWFIYTPGHATGR